MKYQLEKYSDIVEEFKIILPLFYAEVDIYPENPTPDMDHEQLSSVPNLQVITAREDGRLVGLHVAIVHNDIFYKTILTGMVLFYYLLPEFRGNGNGTGMFEYAEEVYKAKKVERIFMSRKIYVNNSEMFFKLGYTQIEANYTKSIK